MKQTKELKDIVKALNAYIKKHKGQVNIIGSFVAFDDKQEVIDDLMFGFGFKDITKISLEELSTEVKKDKEDFINW